MKKLIIIINILFSSLAFAHPPVYLPLGDSYTICEGLEENERWPNLLHQMMKEENTPVELAFNPSKTGYTTNDLIKKELPYLYSSKPDIVTLLIGVNDYVQGYDTADFHQNLTYILNEIQKTIKYKTHIILITIPDYSVTPAGKNYARGRNVPADLGVWNNIIKKEALSRELVCIDIFSTTQKMKDDASLVSADQLHPSAKEVAIWAGMIEQEFRKIVGKYYY